MGAGRLAQIETRTLYTDIGAGRPCECLTFTLMFNVYFVVFIFLICCNPVIIKLHREVHASKP